MSVSTPYCIVLRKSAERTMACVLRVEFLEIYYVQNLWYGWHVCPILPSYARLSSPHSLATLMNADLL